MKQEGKFGLLLIALIVVVAVVFLRPKGLEAALGEGFSADQVTKIQAVLTPTDGGAALQTEVSAGSQDFTDLLTLLQDPSYSRTNRKEEAVTLPYTVDLSLAKEEGWAWAYHFQGGRLIQAGPTGKTKTYQISGGQETQQALLAFLLDRAEG